MAIRDNNPLIPAILQVLRQHTAPLAIHQLLHELKQITEIPALDDDVQLSLFKLNWLMMNALYQLQADWLAQGYYLHISTLDIHLDALPQQQAASVSQQISVQPLREYYLNWHNFSETTKEQVQALLDGVWLHYISGDAQQKAYDVLGLSSGASLSLIRKTYRSLAGRYHPDKGGDAQQFMRVREAYEVLLKARS